MEGRKGKARGEVEGEWGLAGYAGVGKGAAEDIPGKGEHKDR